MAARRVAFVSYRLGGDDGVAVEARKWEWAFHRLGFEIRRVAGEFHDPPRAEDLRLGFLAIDPDPGCAPEPESLAAALTGMDLVIVENLCSLPLNPVASVVTSQALAVHHGRVLFHHHDLPWERPHLAPVDGIPPQRPDSLHVTVSEHARRALEARGIDAFVVHNSFDFDAFEGHRNRTRASMGFATDDVVVLQPTRAIPRKNVAQGIAFAEALAREWPERPVRYWLTGPAEDGFARELDHLLASTRIPITRGRTARVSDAYAASDIVVFPSTWEGFGNPVIEAIAARRPLVVGDYPVLAELLTGMTVLRIDEPRRAAAWLRDPDPDVLEQNLAVARDRFSVDRLPERLRAAFATVGWTDW